VDLAQQPVPTAAPSRWAIVTIAVSWTLLREGVRPDGPALGVARDHVLASLPASVPEDLVDAIAEDLVLGFLERARSGRYRLQSLPAEVPPACAAWRDQLLAALDPVGEIVFRLVYGDGLSLEDVEHRCAVDRIILAGSQEGLRSAVRALVRSQGVAHSSWDVAWTDAILARLAQVPGHGCQGGVELVSPAGRLHAEACPRCGRGLRLIRGGMLSPTQLLPPAETSRRRPDVVNVLALHLHPEARHHRAELAAAFGDSALKVDDDAVMIDLSRAMSPAVVLGHQAELGRPCREHIRGARVRGPGRFTAHALIGPAATEALEATRSRGWGEVDGVGPLPEKGPEPPPMARWWFAAVLAVLLAVLAGMVAWRTGGVEPVYPVAVEFSRGGGEVQARFDTADVAWLVVVSERRGDLELLFAGVDPAHKGELATGEGDYSVIAPADRLLLATSASTFGDLDPLLTAAGLEADPLPALARRLQAVQPRADVVLQEPPSRP